MINLLIPIALLAYTAYLFKRSKSNFFFQELSVLSKKGNLLNDVLKDRGFTDEYIAEITSVYYWFVLNPANFDGATIVADFDTIKGLDASAMVHDFRYLMLRNKGFFFYLQGKLKADIEFGKNMRKLGITWLNAWSRTVLLLLSTLVWIPYVWITGKTKIK